MLPTAPQRDSLPLSHTTDSTGLQPETWTAALANTPISSNPLPLYAQCKGLMPPHTTQGCCAGESHATEHPTMCWLSLCYRVTMCTTPEGTPPVVFHVVLVTHPMR